MWFSNRSDTNRAVQAQKQARSLKVGEVKGELYYLCSENKGADQLRGDCEADLRQKKGADELCSYREADLRLCFCLCKLLVFSRGG